LIEQSLAEIIAGCRRGRETAMRTFYERFYGYALSVCLAHASNHEEAREILNDGFLKAFGGLKNLKNEAVLLPWLRRIMVNTAIDYYRKNQKRATDIAIESVAYMLAEPYLNDNAIWAHLAAEDILAALAQVPLPYRFVFSLYVIEGYSHRDIADQLGLAESTSRAHLTEANRLLRRALTNQTTESHEPTNR
jgi:RNA polymerase sigma factor (sigma-70 family)